MAMDHRLLNDGTKIPVLGLGTWTMGGELRPSTREDEREVEAIRSALEMGFTHIDTAEMYGAGHAEELVGRAIQQFDRRKLFITTKVMPENLRFDDVVSAAKRSLQRLRTEYIDLYLVHIPNPRIPIQETMQAMDYLQDQGLTSHIGVSNFTVSDLEEAREHASHPITVNQIQYNLLTRNRRGHYTANMESDIIPYCREHGILIVAYEPLARAKLTRDVPELLKQIADKYEKTPAQLAINWLINKPGIVAIVKSSNKHHLEENLGALGWHMDPSDLEHLDAAFPN